MVTGILKSVFEIGLKVAETALTEGGGTMDILKAVGATAVELAYPICDRAYSISAQ